MRKIRKKESNPIFLVEKEDGSGFEYGVQLSFLDNKGYKKVTKIDKNAEKTLKNQKGTKS